MHMKKLVLAVASTIRHFRKVCGMSQECLANKAGLDRTYISGVERGVRNITLDSLEQIVNALNISMMDFLEKTSQELECINSDSQLK